MDAVVLFLALALIATVLEPGTMTIMMIVTMRV